MHSHERLKKQAEALRAQLDLTIKQADDADFEEHAQSNAFLNLMADCRGIAREMEFHAKGGLSMQSAEIFLNGLAAKLCKAADDRFAQYLNTRDKKE